MYLVAVKAAVFFFLLSGTICVESLVAHMMFFMLLQSVRHVYGNIFLCSTSIPFCWIGDSRDRPLTTNWPITVEPFMWRIEFSEGSKHHFLEIEPWVFGRRLAVPIFKKRGGRNTLSWKIWQTRTRKIYRKISRNYGKSIPLGIWIPNTPISIMKIPRGDGSTIY